MKSKLSQTKEGNEGTSEKGKAQAYCESDNGGDEDDRTNGKGQDTKESEVDDAKHEGVPKMLPIEDNTTRSQKRERTDSDRLLFAVLDETEAKPRIEPGC